MAASAAWLQREIQIAAPRIGCFLVTSAVLSQIPEIGKIEHGLASFFLKDSHSSVSLNENADPTVRSDLLGAVKRISHDNPATAGSLLGNSLNIPIQRGSLDLGTWQGIYLGNWADAHATRTLVVTLRSFDGTAKSHTSITAPGRGCMVISDNISKKLPSTKHDSGLLTLLIKHTSASLTVNDVSDPLVHESMEAALNQLVPEQWNEEFFEHTYEGPDDMPAHVKSSLFGAFLTLPLTDGRINAGPDKGIYLCEHRDGGGWGGGHSRKISMAVMQDDTVVQRVVNVAAPHTGFQSISEQLRKAVPELASVSVGLCHLFLQDMCASLTIGPKAEETPAELEKGMADMVPESWNGKVFKHPHMTSFVMSSLLGSSLTIPVSSGALNIGDDLDVFLGVHQGAKEGEKRVVVTVQGVADACQ